MKKKSVSELHKLLAELRESLLAMRFKDAGKQLKNVRDLRVTKKDIARVLTLIKQKSSATPAVFTKESEVAAQTKNK
ncbi:MAG: 50S ribosomal protein L29 [bacterium]|nr:50S ribosomal protein L29 [bacterium]